MSSSTQPMWDNMIGLGDKTSSYFYSTLSRKKEVVISISRFIDLDWRFWYQTMESQVSVWILFISRPSISVYWILILLNVPNPMSESTISPQIWSCCPRINKLLIVRLQGYLIWTKVLHFPLLIPLTILISQNLYSVCCSWSGCVD